MSREIKIEKKTSEVIQPIDGQEARQAIRERKDLSGAVMQGMALNNLNTVGACLRKTNLTKANLSHGLLINPNFYKASLNSAAFHNTILLGGDLVKSRFFETNLSDSALIGVDGEDSSFEKANLRNAALINSRFVNANFREANLSNARLASLNVANADFTGANLSGARAYAVNWNDAMVPPTLLPKPFVHLPKWVFSALIGGLLGGLALIIYTALRKKSQKTS